MAQELLLGAWAEVPEIRMRDPRGLWHAYATVPLAALLYTSSPAGLGTGMGWVRAALDNTEPEGADEPGWAQVTAVCATKHVLLSGAVTFLQLDDRQRDSVLLTILDVLAPAGRHGLEGWSDTG